MTNCFLPSWRHHPENWVRCRCRGWAKLTAAHYHTGWKVSHTFSQPNAISISETRSSQPLKWVWAKNWRQTDHGHTNFKIPPPRPPYRGVHPKEPTSMGGFWPWTDKLTDHQIHSCDSKTGLVRTGLLTQHTPTKVCLNDTCLLFNEGGWARRWKNHRTKWRLTTKFM